MNRLTGHWIFQLVIAGCLTVLPGCGTEDGADGNNGVNRTDGANSLPSRATASNGPTSESDASIANYDPNDLRMRAVVDGKESRLLQKAVVAAYPVLLHNTWPPDNEKGELIEPWSIFFRLRENNGNATASSDGKDYRRVGDSDGRPFGWIQADQLVEWNSRFILAPVSPVNEETRFSGRTADGGRFSHQDAQGRQTWCLLKKPPEDNSGSNSTYDFWFWAGPLETAGKSGTLAEDYKNLQNIKLEVAVLVETAANYMELDYGDYTPLKVAKSAIERLSKELESKPELKGEVRVAVAGFSDENHSKPYNLIQDFTADINEIQNAAGRISIDVLDSTVKADDLYVDGMTAIDNAINRLEWSEFSIKHIIVIGAGPFAENPPGTRAAALRRPTTDVETLLSPEGWAALDNKSVYTWVSNRSGRSLNDLTRDAYPQFGERSKTLLARKQVHSLVIPCDQSLWLEAFMNKEGFDDDVKSTIRDIIDKVNDLIYTGKMTAEEFLSYTEASRTFIVFGYRMALLNAGSNKAERQYEALTDPGSGNPAGFYRRATPTADGLRAADEELTLLITNGVEAVREAKRGQVKNAAGTGSDTQAMRRAAFQVTDALGNKRKLDRAVTGIAAPRNSNGYAWAEERVLVSRTELEELTSTVQAVYEQFRAKTRKSDRQDVGKIIEELARIMAKTASGQKIPADVPLKELITDLPLKTEALNTTAQQIAVMTSDDFRAWLDGLRLALERCRFILDQGDDKWFALSAKSAADKVVVVKISELP